MAPFDRVLRGAKEILQQNIITGNKLSARWTG